MDGWESGEDDTATNVTKTTLQEVARANHAVGVSGAAINRWGQQPLHKVAKTAKHQTRPRTPAWRNSLTKAPPPGMQPLPMPTQQQSSTPQMQHRGEVHLMRDYSSSESDDWGADEEDVHMKPSPVLAPAAAPTNVPGWRAAMARNSQRQSTSEVMRGDDSGHRAADALRAATPPSIQSEKNRADRISATRMAEHYGVGFNLMSKMGIKSEDIQAAPTPVVFQRRDKDEGIVADAEASHTSKKRRRYAEAATTNRTAPPRRQPVSSSDESSGSSSDDDDDDGPDNIPSTEISRPAASIRETLKDIAEASRSENIIDMRGPTPQVTKYSQEALVSAWKQQRGPLVATNNGTKDRQNAAIGRLEQISALISQCEAELLAKAQQLTEDATAVLKQQYAQPEPVKNEGVKRELDGDDAEEEHMTIGGGGATTPPSSSTPPLADALVPLTPANLLLAWLDNVFQEWEAKYSDELEQLNFRDIADGLVEIALYADLQTLQVRDERFPMGSSEALPKSSATWKRIITLVCRFREFIVTNETRAGLFDELMKRTLVARMITPWLNTMWNIYSGTDVAIQLMEGSLQLVMTPAAYKSTLNAVVTPLLVNALEAASASDFILCPPHHWLSPWLAILPPDATDRILNQLTTSTLDGFNTVDIHSLASANNWIFRWKGILNKTAWTSIVFTGVFGLLKRYLSCISPVEMSSEVPETLGAFMTVWKDDLPEPLVSSTVVDIFGARLIHHLECDGAQTYGAAANADSDLTPGMKALEGYASWKSLRKAHLPGLKTWLTQVLQLLDRAIRSGAGGSSSA